MNCPYKFVFYDKDTMPFFFLPPRGNALTSHPHPYPLPSRERGIWESIGGELSLLLLTLTPALSRQGRGEYGRIEVGAGNRSELFTYDNITER